MDHFVKLEKKILKNIWISRVRVSEKKCLGFIVSQKSTLDTISV